MPEGGDVMSVKVENPNHHIWCKGGMYWCYVTIRYGRMSERKYFSLRTKDVEEARRRRDFLFKKIGNVFTISSRYGKV